MIRRIIQILLKKYIFANRILLLRKKIDLYQSITDQQEIYKIQLMKVNEQWKYAYQNIPFYRQWKDEHSLPDEIESIEELNGFPKLTKQDIMDNQEFIQEGLENYYLTSTGGTSGITTHFPTSKSDADEAYANAYLGRSWWGIKPFSRILMYWGHSHLFGNGINGYINKIKHNFNNWLINTTKISSYGLDIGNIKSFYNLISDTKAETIISYTSNLFKICQYIESEGLKREQGALKNVIITSETATDADVTLISNKLKTRVIHEYGMAETGVIAYSYEETNNIRVLWDSFIINVDKNGRLFLTTIGQKIFPLFNYDSEDWVEYSAPYKGSVLSLQFIKGKIRNILSIPNTQGKILTISTIFFDHVLKYYPGIYALQYRQLDSAVEVILSSDKELDLIAIKEYLQKEASKEFANINYQQIKLVQGESSKTLAGKHKVFVN